MQYDKRNHLLRDAFKLVEKYDPQTYAQMKAEDWQVSTYLDEASPEYWPSIIHDMTALTSYGVTLSDSDGPIIPQPETWINVPMINVEHEETGVDKTKFTASILVHEFAHRHHGAPGFRGDEVDAGTIGLQFSRKIEGRDGLLITEVAKTILEQNS